MVLLGGRLSPVLVDAVLELDDGEVAHFDRQGLVQEDRLGMSVYVCIPFTCVHTCSSG
jgi:hypothetical protein